MHTPSFATPRPRESRRGSLARTLASRAAAALVLLAGAAMIASALAGTSRDDTTVFRVGLAVALIGSTLWVLAQTRATDRQIECIRQAAYDDGYLDGCEETAEEARVVYIRPVPSAGLVVPSAPTVAGDGTAHEFGEKLDVGQGA